MKLQLDELGRIPANYPKTFYRVEDWLSGRMIADYSTPAEAEKAARDHARDHGCRYMPKVATMHRNV